MIDGCWGGKPSRKKIGLTTGAESVQGKCIFSKSAKIGCSDSSQTSKAEVPAAVRGTTIVHIYVPIPKKTKKEECKHGKK